MKFFLELYRKVMNGERQREAPSSELEILQTEFTKTRVARGQKSAAHAILSRSGEIVATGGNGTGTGNGADSKDTVEFESSDSGVHLAPRLDLDCPETKHRAS